MKIILHALIILTIGQFRSFPATAATTFSVCEVLPHPTHFRGKYVRIRATYVTALREHTILMDPQCPSKIILPYDSTKSPLDKSVSDFDRALITSDGTPGLRRFLVDISGRIKWKSKAPRIYIDKFWSFEPVK